MNNIVDNTTNPLRRLTFIMKKLLDPDGCPWDREQNHATLKPYIIEEAYEVCDAIDSGNDENLKEELGDVALQVVFHAELARREGKFDINDVLNTISDKMLRRHPHVFGNVVAETSKEVLENWEEIKKQEKGYKNEKPPSILDGMPKSMPALAAACRIQERAANVGFDWDNIKPVWDKVHEEIAELHEARVIGHQEEIEEEFGDMLFALVNVARFMNINPEQALRKCIAKFNSRFRYIEKKADETGKKLKNMTLEEMDMFWNEAKKK